MRVVHAAVAAKPSVTVGDDDVPELIDALWAHGTEQDRLQHIYGQAGLIGIDLVLFFLEDDGPSRHEARTEALLNRCLSASPGLSRKFRLLAGT